MVLSFCYSSSSEMARINPLETSDKTQTNRQEFSNAKREKWETGSRYPDRNEEESSSKQNYMESKLEESNTGRRFSESKAEESNPGRPYTESKPEKSNTGRSYPESQTEESNMVHCFPERKPEDPGRRYLDKELGGKIELSRWPNGTDDVMIGNETNDRNNRLNDQMSTRASNEWLDNRSKTLPRASFPRAASPLQNREIAGYLDSVSNKSGTNNQNSPPSRHRPLAETNGSLPPSEKEEGFRTRSRRWSRDQSLPTNNQSDSGSPAGQENGLAAAGQWCSDKSLNNNSIWSRTDNSHLSERDPILKLNQDRSTTMVTQLSTERLVQTKSPHRSTTPESIAHKTPTSDRIDTDYISKIARIDSDYIARLADKFSDRGKTDFGTNQLISPEPDVILKLTSSRAAAAEQKKTTGKSPVEGIFKPGFLLRPASKSANTMKPEPALRGQDGKLSEQANQKAKNLLERELDERTRLNNEQNRKQTVSIFRSGFLVEARRRDGVQDSTSLKVGRFLVEDGLEEDKLMKKPEVKSSPSTLPRDWRSGHTSGSSTPAAGLPRGGTDRKGSPERKDLLAARSTLERIIHNGPRYNRFSQL